MHKPLLVFSLSFGTVAVDVPFDLILGSVEVEDAVRLSQLIHEHVVFLSRWDQVIDDEETFARKLQVAYKFIDCRHVVFDVKALVEGVEGD